MIPTNSKMPAAWRRSFFLLCLLGFHLVSRAGVQAQALPAANRWKINPDGSTSWVIDQRIPHADHIEMSEEKISTIDAAAEEKQRRDLVNQWWNNFVLETPDETLNCAFAFAKLRGSESIYRTQGGLMHGPGGGAYYAAIRANDQAEYIGPFFPFLGYQVGNEVTSPPKAACIAGCLPKACSASAPLA